MAEKPDNLAFRCMENPFVIGRDNAIFSPHDGLGFIVNNGGFVGRDRFISRSSAIEELKEGTGPVIINMGDSSTSGWHSDMLSRDRDNKPTDPYFHYKTYSDLMREVFGRVINAGVSKYTTLQGKKYLALILRDFAKHNIYPDYVTLYFGNNDSVFSRIEDKTAIDGMLPTRNNTYKRVLLADYKRNLEEMIRLIRCYGAIPIIIIPPRRYDWPPALRSLKYKEERKVGIEELEPVELRTELEKASQLFWEDRLEEAYEKDVFLPRIKKIYVEMLIKTAKRQNVDIIDVQKDVPFHKSGEFFCDYCHPLEPTNELILREFLRIKEAYKIPLRYRILEGTINFLGHFIRPGRSGRSDKHQPPTDIYPLH